MLHEDEKGFSLIEVMVAATILAVFLMALLRFMGDSVDKANQVNDNLVARRILDEQISKILAIRGAFPRIKGQSGTLATYVACFDKDGKLVANKNNVTGFVAVDIPEGQWKELSAVCPRGGKQGTVFEFHVHPVASKPMDRVQAAWIYFFVINAGKKSQFVDTLLEYPASL